MKIADLTPGDMIAFRIVPDPDCGQINAGRWGLLKVLRTDEDDLVTLAPYADIFDALPKMGWLARPKPLVQKRFPYYVQTHGEMQAIVTPLAGNTVDLPDAQIIKSGVKFTSQERETIAIFEDGRHAGSFMAWETVSMIIDHEDRAVRDTDAWKADIARRQAENEAKWAAQRAREAERLRGITLDQLASETPFPEWDNRTKIIPPVYREAARKRVLDLVANLQPLGPKPKRKDVRAELKACVEWFNAVDGTMGYAIETVEREDIHRALEEICWACKQKPLVDEIENWRDW